MSEPEPERPDWPSIIEQAVLDGYSVTYVAQDGSNREEEDEDE